MPWISTNTFSRWNGTADPLLNTTHANKNVTSTTTKITKLTLRKHFIDITLSKENLDASRRTTAPLSYQCSVICRHVLYYLVYHLNLISHSSIDKNWNIRKSNQEMISSSLKRIIEKKVELVIMKLFKTTININFILFTQYIAFSSWYITTEVTFKSNIPIPM